MDKIKKALEKATGSTGREIKIEMPSSNIPSLSKRQEILPIYKKTKVVPLDKEHLRKNKIFSFFYEENMIEQLKMLRTRIINRLEEIGGNSLLITSPLPREGKTLTAINLAISIAQEFDKTVLLVDSNLKNPSIHSYLGLKVEKGLAQVLLKRINIPEVLINPDIPRLVVLPAGGSFSSSAELLGSPYAENIFFEMKTRYQERLIIFDSPSILKSADPLVLSKYVDAIVLVIEAEKTPREDIKKALELLQEKPVIGVVLNKVKD